MEVSDDGSRPASRQVMMGRSALRVTLGMVLYPINMIDIKTHRSRR